MRLLRKLDPRWIVLLLLPVLVTAAAVQEHRPQPAAARAAAHPEPLRFPHAVAAAEARALAPAPAAQRAPAAQAVRALPRVHLRASRTGTRSHEQRGQAALASLDYDWQRLGYRVQFRPYDGRSLGSANRVTRTITVYVKRGQSEISLRTSLAHELGHALDFEHGDESRRATYRRVRGLSTSSSWWPCNRCTDFSSPAGDFAEVFATWLVGPGDFRSRLKGPPSARELQELTPLFQVPTAAAPADPAVQPAPQDEQVEHDPGLPPLPDPGRARG